MTDDWKGLFKRGRVIPPHSQTARQAQDSSHTHSQGFQITLKHLDGPHIQREKKEGGSEGSQKREPVKYQLSVTLFDTSHQHFFGRTWKSSPQKMSGVHRAMFNEVVYLHTSLRLPSVVAVVELVALQPRADGSQHALGCGFAILHLFSSMTEPQATEGDRRLSLYHGTPRTLLHPLLRDPIEQNKLLTPIDGAHLVCSLKPHPALAPAMHLFPQNMLVSGDENIPGVTPSPTGDSLLKPHMVKSLTCFLDRLSISLHPSLEKFESQLLQHVSTDCHNTKHSGPESSAVVVIQERRLHVGVHNGWGFLERPQVVVLETTEATDWSRGRTSGGTSRQGTLTRDCSSSSSQSLALRSSLELKLPSHQAVGIALQLEYVFSSPLIGDGKLSSTSTISRTAFMQCLRWGVWCPFQEWGALRAKEVKLSLQGGSTPNPYGIMAYTSSSNSQSPAQVVDERDVVRFRLSSSSVQKASSSTAVSLRRSRTGQEEMAAQQRKPPSPGLSRRASQASPPGSPQGPGLSMSQLAATSRYPTMSHSTAVSPWQQPFSSQLYPSPLASAHQLSHVELPGASNITHLEVDLNVSPRDGLPAYQSAALANEGHLELQELPFTPIHAPIITMGTHAAPSSSSVSSRSSLAHLYSAGFPYITDPSGLVAEVLDPTEPVNFDPQREEADPLQGNVLLLQFLAFSRIPQQGGSSNWPDSVHFTFQLYRFPPVTTQRLKLLGIDKLPKKSSETPPCVLAVINKDGTVNSGSPGLQLQFRVDGAFLHPGERRWFLRYLALHTLQVDVWDSQSLLLIGSTALGLKHMLRQGRPAVQATHELEVITTEYMGEGVPVNLHRAPNPISVFTTVKGRLHLRLGNVGCPVDQNKPNKPQCLPPSRSHIISPLDATSGFTGGSLSSKSIQRLNVRNAARAQRLVELDGDLVPLLQSHMKEGGGTPRTNTPWWGETDDVRQRKLNRMVAVRQHEGGQDGTGSDVKTKVTGRRAERAQLARDLRLMQAYRERSKAEGITHILSQAITIHHTLYATLGTAEYLEYVLRNPFNTPQTVTIYSEDPELSVITDCDEWRYFKALTKTLTPLEEDMFHLKEGTLAPQVYLRPKESVHVPLKYQTFVSDNSVVPQGPSLIPSGRSTQVSKKHLSNTVLAKSIKVTFRAEDGKPLAICQVSVEPTPHVIDQTFRFYQPELSFLKKALRLPPWERTPVGDTDAGSQISVRCSDPNVICETKMLAQGEPQDVYLKVPGSPSPQIRKFFVTVFTDKWLAVPAQVWQVYVHFLQRVDISCVTGQRTCQSLVIRGTQATRKVRCYTSHPQELKVDPAEVFVLLPGVVQDLQLCVCPLRVGSRFCYLTVVDVEQHTLVACWLLSLTCRLPILSKAFEMCAPVGGGRGSTRKITYTNPYPTSRVLLLRSDHPDLLQFKEDRFEIGGGETYRIGLRFAPSQSPGAQEILIYINNQEETTEETFCVKVKYT